MQVQHDLVTLEPKYLMSFNSPLTAEVARVVNAETEGVIFNKNHSQILVIFDAKLNTINDR